MVPFTTVNVAVLDLHTPLTTQHNVVPLLLYPAIIVILYPVLSSVGSEAKHVHVIFFSSNLALESLPAPAT